MFFLLFFIVNNLNFLNKTACFLSSNNISKFSSCYNVVQLKAIITHAELQEECNNHHNVTQLKCNLELCTLKGEIIQVHLYCRSNQHLPPLHHVKEMIRRLSNGYFDLKKRNEKINNNDKHVFLKICMLGHYVSYCRFNFSQATVKYKCNKVSYMLKVCNII